MVASSTPGTAEQRAAHRMQADGRDAVVVGQQDLHALVEDSRATDTGLDDSVTNVLQVEAVRGHRVTGLAPRSSAQQKLEFFDRESSCGDAEHRSDEDANHVTHEAVGLDPELEHPRLRLDPFRPKDPPFEPPVRRLGGRERGEVVRPPAGARRTRRAQLDRSDTSTPARDRARTRSPATLPARGSGMCALGHRGARRSPPARPGSPGSERPLAGDRSGPRQGARCPGGWPPAPGRAHPHRCAPPQSILSRPGPVGQSRPARPPPPCVCPAAPPSRQSRCRRTRGAAERSGLSALARDDHEVLDVHRDRAVAAGPSAQELQLVCEQRS